MVVEHLVGIGRRNALERTAHCLLEFGARLKLVGLATKTGYDCPLSQYMLADASGLSAVQVNRVLQEKTATGFHMAKYEGGPYLKKSELRNVWARCGEILHRGTLKSLVKAQNPVQINFGELNDWGQKILNLLGNHRIVRQDQQLAFIAFLQSDAIGGEVQVILGEAVRFGEEI